MTMDLRCQKKGHKMAVMAKKKPDRHKSKPFQLRMPDFLKEQLEKLADQNYSTMTAEIIAAIKKHLEASGFATHR